MAVSGQTSENVTFNYRGTVETANFLGHLFRTIGQVLNISTDVCASEAAGGQNNEAEDEEGDAKKGGCSEEKKRNRRQRRNKGEMIHRDR